MSALFVASSAFAAQAAGVPAPTGSTSQFQVTASITAAPCTDFNTTAINFGPIAEVGTHQLPDTKASGTITVDCPSDLAYTITLDGGLNPQPNNQNSNLGIRGMSSGSAILPYDIVMADQANPAVCNYNDYRWGYAGSLSVNHGPEGFSGNGSLQTIATCGEVYAETSPGAGSYADTVTATLTY